VFLLAITFAAGFLLWLRSRSGIAWRDAILVDTPSRATSSWLLDGIWFVAGFLVLGAALCLLEWQQPYYFTQDDALVAELPGILVGCRGIWQGIWPSYNPYPLMGAPLANLGLYSLTYPPTYLAYAIARDLLGNEYATLEIFAVLHLIAGYAVTFGLMRQLRTSSAVAAMVALCVVLSGSSLIMGRSWHAFVPLVVWLPVLAWGLVRLCQGPVGWLWTVAMGTSIGLTFHVGFPQMSLWVLGFFVAAVATLVLLGDVPRRRAYQALPAVLFGLGIALPIALPQLRAAETMGRREMMGEGLPFPDAYLCMLLPYPLAQAPHPNAWGTFDREYMGQMYFFGGLLGVLFFANVLALISSGFRGLWWRGQMWRLAGLVTLLLMAGQSGGLWGLLGKMPVLGRVSNHPFRLLPFFVLFASIPGGLVLERTLRCSTRRRAWEVLLGASVGGILLYHAWLARPAFYTFPFRPYPALPESMNAILGLPADPTGRLMAWSPRWSTHPATGFSLPHALAGPYGVPAFHGYDPVVQCTLPHAYAAQQLLDSPLAAARAYGIRWHLTVRGVGPVRSENPEMYEVEEEPPYEKAFHELQPLKLPCAYESGALLLTELDNVDPLAFVEGRAYPQLPLRMHAAGIDVDIGSAGGKSVIVNFLWRPEMKASVNGVGVPCERDDWLRIRVRIPPGGQKLEVRYAPDWTRGLLIGFTAILFGVVVQLQLVRNTQTTELASRGP